MHEVTEALTAAGIDAGSYSGHSFRISAVTAAAQVGIPACTIRMLGHWKSDAYQLYVRTPWKFLL